MKIFSKICRICLKSYEKNDELLSVFENDDENIKIAKKIYDVSGIFIEKSYNTPEKICRYCFDTLNISYKFRQLCQTSDIKLKSYKCKDELYVKNVLKSVSAADLEIDSFFKIEDDLNLTDEDVHFEDEGHEEEENQKEELEEQHFNDYEEYEVISEDFTNSVEAFSPNGDFSPTLNKIQSVKKKFKKKNINQNESLEDDYLLENEEAMHPSNKTKQYESSLKYHKDRNLYIFKQEWRQKYGFIQPGYNENTAKCTLCNCHLALTYKGESAITSHIKTGKHMSNSGIDALRKEETLNKEENVHICDICGNKYSNLHMLKRHMKYHSDVMDYECELCPKQFRQMMQLKRHMRIHTGEKPYSCKYCNKAIRDYSTKIRHERMHTDERPYICPTCNKGFQYPFVLKNHLKIHTGEKLYECVICNKNFTLKKHLTSHLETMLHKSRALKIEENNQLKSA